MAQGYSSATAVSTTAIANAIVDSGRTFIARYLNEKAGVRDGLTLTEAQRISSAGLTVVSLYEQNSGTTVTSFTSSQGNTDANAAITKAILAGQPVNTPIYFCIDCDPTPAQMTSNIVPYVQAIIAVLASPSINRYNYKLGIYGSPYVCSYIRGTYSPTERYMFAVIGNGWRDSSPSFTAWNMKQYQWNQQLANYSSKYLVDYVESSSYGGGGWRP